MTMALEGGEGSGSRPGRSLLPGKTRYPLYRRLGGPQGWSGQVRKISPPTGIRSPDRPSRTQSLYRLSYRGPQVLKRILKNMRGEQKLRTPAFHNIHTACCADMRRGNVTGSCLCVLSALSLGNWSTQRPSLMNDRQCPQFTVMLYCPTVRS